jgi:hypothetical protein
VYKNVGENEFQRHQQQGFHPATSNIRQATVKKGNRRKVFG